MNIVLLVGKFKGIQSTNNEHFPYKIKLAVQKAFKSADGSYGNDEFLVYVSDWWSNIVDSVEEKIKQGDIISCKCSLGYINNKLCPILEKITFM